MSKGALYTFLFSVIVIAFFISSCKKTSTLTSGGTILFSADTLKFDTVFTAAGSYTNWVTIYNPQSEAVVISSIRLQSGAATYFHLNVDGKTGNTAGNIKIAPHDSIYVFATVNINPNDSLTPFLINDALIATMNGKDFSVPFTAYGQNAHYIISDSLTKDTNWLTDKPYVVIHNCVVGQGVNLNIPRGCRVYMHQDAQIIVYPLAGLNIGQSGKQGDSVVFQGDRLDRAYFGYVGYPGEWCGIWLTPLSSGNISNAILKNCGNGAAYYNYTIIPAAIRVDSGAKLNIDHSVIENSISLGLLGFEGNITANVCNINTTGGQALAISQGGTDTLINCTFANYGTAQTSHANAGTAAILDYYSPDGTHYYYGDMQVFMQNCIVYGTLDSEIVCDTTGSPRNTRASLVVNNCLLKMGHVREPFITFSNCLFNQDPMFKNSSNGDFHISASSPAAGKGIFMSGTDLDGKPWTAPTDIGCYRSN